MAETAAPEAPTTRPVAPSVYTETTDPDIRLDQNGQPCLNISKVVVLDERGRKEFGEIPQLAQSMRDFGFFSVIVVVPSPDKPGFYNLVAGERRYRAALLAGLAFIPFMKKSEYDLVKQKEVELEENVRRKEMSWPEQLTVLHQVHKYKQQLYGIGGAGLDGGWKVEDTARIANLSKSDASHKLRAAKRLAARPDLAKMVTHLPMSVAMTKLDQLEAGEQMQAKVEAGTVQLSADVRHIDAIEGLRALADASIDCCITDPPFGDSSIDVEQTVKATAVNYTAALKPSDNLDAETMRQLMEQIVPELARVLKPGAHLYLFFAFEHYSFLTGLLSEYDFLLEEEPIIWAKGKTTNPSTGYGWGRSYEPILHAHNGTRTKHLFKSFPNVIQCPPIPSKKRYHPFQKPAAVLAQLIDASTQIGETILDPFAGSAQTIRIARALKRSALGFEIDQANWMQAQLNLALPIEEKIR